jgi:hypothetical protein
VVAAVLLLNLRTLDANAGDPRVLSGYAYGPSQLYALCDRLRDRPDGNVAFASQRVRAGWGWEDDAAADEQTALRTWGELRFVCDGLTGARTSSLAEVWPVSVPDGTFSLAQTAPGAEVQRIIDTLAIVMPGIGAPDLREVSPADIWELVIYDVTAAEVNARQGLSLEWLDATGAVIEEHIAGGPDFAPGTPPDGGVRFRLHGLVYADEPPVVLEVSGAGEAATVILDGVLFKEPAEPATTLPGWHRVEIEAPAPGPSAVGLRWRMASGALRTIEPHDAFALPPGVSLYRHERTYVPPGGGEPFTALRYDTWPHPISFDGLRLGTAAPLPAGTRATVDRWFGVWSIPSTQTYRITLSGQDQRISVVIDGRRVEGADAVLNSASVDVPLTAGEHTVQLTFQPIRDEVWQIGGTIDVRTASGEPVTLRVRPALR